MALKDKDLFTTSEVARVCGISKQKIVNLFDQGEIGGFKIPGPPGSKSRARRVPKKDLLEFMRKNNIPTDALEDTRKRILVVDDDPASLELVCDVFRGREREYEIRTALNASDAAVLAGTFAPDLILLDLMLPDLDGAQIYKSIRKLEKLASTKVIIVSALTDKKRIESMLEAGAVAYITKPIDMQKLKDEVESALASVD